MVCKEQERKGMFVLVSADDAIVRDDAYAIQFATHKKEAEDYLIDKCNDIVPCILRPGPVYKHGLMTSIKQTFQRNQGLYIDRRTG